MSHYAYGKVQVDCDVETMKRVLEMLVPEWKGKVETSKNDKKLKLRGPNHDDNWDIRVSTACPGIRYEDWGMRREGTTWKTAHGYGAKIGKQSPTQFEKELAGSIGKLHAKDAISEANGFSIVESEQDEWSVFDFTTDVDDYISKVSL